MRKRKRRREREIEKDIEKQMKNERKRKNKRRKPGDLEVGRDGGIRRSRRRKGGNRGREEDMP